MPQCRPCGNELRPGARFCARCGAPADAEPPAETTRPDARDPAAPAAITASAEPAAPVLSAVDEPAEPTVPAATPEPALSGTAALAEDLLTAETTLLAPLPTVRSPAGASTSGPGQAAVKSERYARLRAQGDDAPDLALQVADLRAVVRSLVLDVVVHTRMLRESPLWDENRFRTLRLDQIVRHHFLASSPLGERHSAHPYTLSEGEYWVSRMGLRPIEVQQFEARVQALQGGGH